MSGILPYPQRASVARLAAPCDVAPCDVAPLFSVDLSQPLQAIMTESCAEYDSQNAISELIPPPKDLIETYWRLAAISRGSPNDTLATSSLGAVPAHSLLGTCTLPRVQSSGVADLNRLFSAISWSTRRRTRESGFNSSTVRSRTKSRPVLFTQNDEIFLDRRRTQGPGSGAALPCHTERTGRLAAKNTPCGRVVEVDAEMFINKDRRAEMFAVRPNHD